MTLVTGARLGAYEIQSALGAGGMGEVYRARDTRLNRDVALKVLPEVFTLDLDRLARFKREAQVLASLNHPNIGGIYGLEDADSIHALVLELVEGPTLADRISQGPIPLDETLPIARQIAGALEAAHEAGIIHRDLKPANIKVRPDGTVKVLDFGLAKALDPGSSSPAAAALSNSPTITSPAATRMGVLMGTAAYMSPEQARGKVVDKRTDIWAFGCVLYEMLTGQRAFPGEDVTDTLAAVVRAEPDWTQLPANFSSALGTYIRRCLQKDPRQRVQAIGDVRLALEGAFEVAGPQTAAPNTSPASGGQLAWIAFAGATVVAAILAIPALRHVRETPPSLPETRTDIVTPATVDPVSFALSPDGLQIVFVAHGDGASRLWLRSLTATTAQPLAGTEGAAYPFWSPDSRSVGFFADGKLKRLDIVGGALQILAIAVPRGGTWNADGVILFPSSSVGPLFRVSASGGQTVAATKLDRQTGHRFPSFLPNGHQFLFLAQGAPETAGILLGLSTQPKPIG